MLAAQTELDAAWALVEPRLGDWWPVDPAQVAPIELITDPPLREMLTPERAATVPATPRGPGRTG